MSDALIFGAFFLAGCGVLAFMLIRRANRIDIPIFGESDDEK